MHTVLGAKFPLGVLATLVLSHKESMESKMEIFSCEVPTLSSSWIWLVLRWHIYQPMFPVFCWLASFGWVWWEHLICSGWIQQLKPQHKTVHYSQTLGSTFKQLPNPINSKSRTPSFYSEYKSEFSQGSRRLSKRRPALCVWPLLPPLFISL